MKRTKRSIFTKASRMVITLMLVAAMVMADAMPYVYAEESQVTQTQEAETALLTETSGEGSADESAIDESSETQTDQSSDDESSEDQKETAENETSTDESSADQADKSSADQAVTEEDEIVDDATPSDEEVTEEDEKAMAEDTEPDPVVAHLSNTGTQIDLSDDNTGVSVSLNSDILPSGVTDVTLQVKALASDSAPSLQ